MARHSSGKDLASPSHGKADLYYSIGAAAVAIGLALVASLWPLETTFDVSTSTDRLELTTARGFSEPWFIRCATWRVLESAAAEPVDGVLQLDPGVRVGVQRIARGELHIEFGTQSAGHRVGRLVGASGARRVVPDSTVLTFPAHCFEERGGIQLALPFSGTLRLPDSGRVPGLPGQPMVHSTVVRLLGRTLLGGRLYDGGKTELGLGDGIEVVDGGSGAGFVFLDASPRLQVSYRTRGSRCLVRRFGGTGYETKVSTWARVRGDEVLQALWSSFTLTFAWLTLRSRKA